MFRGKLSYPLTEYESVWRTSMFLKKDKDTSNSVASIVNNICKENLKVDELLKDMEEL